MVEGIIDFYFYGMDLHSRVINMIVFLSECGVVKFQNKLARRYLQDI